MTPQANISVTIIVPAFNESQQIAYTVRILKNYLEHHSIIHDLIIVDDGSTDDTSHVTRLVAGQWPNVIVLSTGTNRGKGFAVRQGMLKSTRDVALFMDADLSTPQKRSLLLYAKLKRVSTW